MRTYDAIRLAYEAALQGKVALIVMPKMRITFDGRQGMGKDLKGSGFGALNELPDDMVGITVIRETAPIGTSEDRPAKIRDHPMRELQGALAAVAELVLLPANDLLHELEWKLENLRQVLLGSAYPCPICSRSPTQHTSPGIVTLDWDHETDDMGYKMSSWPVFSSTCEDAERGYATLRGSAPDVRDRGIPRNHGEQLNKALLDGGTPEEIAYVLGAAQERERLARMLGIVPPSGRWW